MCEVIETQCFVFLPFQFELVSASWRAINIFEEMLISCRIFSTMLCYANKTKSSHAYEII